SAQPRPLARPGLWFYGNRLEDKLRTQLQDATKVGAVHFEQSGSAGPNAAGVTGGIWGRCAGTGHRAGEAVPLRVVEDVESFGAELEGHALLDGEVLEHSHIEV